MQDGMEDWKRNNMDYKDLTIEQIKEALDSFWPKDPKEDKARKMPYVKELPSGGWEISTGHSTFWCNDAGKKLFDEAMEKEAAKFLESVPGLKEKIEKKFNDFLIRGKK